MSPLRKRWIAGLAAAALCAVAGVALAQDQPLISPPPGYAPPPPNAQPPDPGDLPTERDNAGSGPTNEDMSVPQGSGYGDQGAPGNSADQGGALPPMRGSTANEQPMDIGITPPPPAGATPPPPEGANPATGLTPDTAPGDVTALPAQPETAPPEATHPQALPRAPAEPGGEVAVLRGLDKISARVTVVNAPIGKPVTFGRLKIIADYCHKRPPELPPEVAAFVRIDDTRVKDAAKARIFSGWMYASSPALHAVEHPVYDVWLIDCRTSTPESEFGTLPKEPLPKEDSTKRIR
ncbi:MAG TPA: DUF2155 domain-containing protein [Alphaproteobacteria bacterium]|nr:DUF2155 domain-containing protein [Alphaproteobacteria bacterium]